MLIVLNTKIWKLYNTLILLRSASVSLLISIWSYVFTLLPFLCLARTWVFQSNLDFFLYLFICAFKQTIFNVSEATEREFQVNILAPFFLVGSFGGPTDG